jgi:hypothetical protein
MRRDVHDVVPGKIGEKLGARRTHGARGAVTLDEMIHFCARSGQGRIVGRHRQHGRRCGRRVRAAAQVGQERGGRHAHGFVRGAERRRFPRTHDGFHREPGQESVQRRIDACRRAQYIGCARQEQFAERTRCRIHLARIAR